MKLSISNLTWDYQEDEAVKDALLDLSVYAIEVAPTKIWENPLLANSDSVKRYRDYWNEDRINIVALQSLLFGRSDLVIFSNEQKRLETFEYLCKIIEIGADLGVKSFVFGSPKNRMVGGMSSTQAMDIAIDFFHQLGEKAKQFSAVFCIEPNPIDYGCDFINTAEEGIALVKEVGSSGFGLHLDAGGMTLSNENIESSIEKAAPYLSHFHISEPQLNLVQNGLVNHKVFARKLKEINYDGYISIEMKPGLSESNVETVRKSLEFVKTVYL